MANAEFTTWRLLIGRQLQVAEDTPHHLLWIAGLLIRSSGHLMFALKPLMSSDPGSTEKRVGSNLSWNGPCAVKPGRKGEDFSPKRFAIVDDDMSFSFFGRFLFTPFTQYPAYACDPSTEVS